MAHEVETMMYVGEAPWHGLGTAIPDGKNLSIREAITAAGLDWEVGMKKVFAADDGEKPAPLPDHMATYRTADGRVLGIVGEGYRPLQNREAFLWFQPFLDSKMVTLHTAGSLFGGRRIWVLARVEKGLAAVRAGDEVRQFILLSSSHDGSLAVRVGFTPIRVVCNNTLCLAHGSEASRLLKVRHSSGLIQNLAIVRETMSLAAREFLATMRQFRRLAARQIDAEGLEKYVRKVFDIEKTGGDLLVPRIIRLFEAGRGTREAGATYWGAYNAVNEYCNYFRGKTPENTLNGIWFGKSAELNRKALHTALKMAA